MTDNLPLYFVGVCLPNESEPEQTLEVGILSWSERPNERPRVYVHTYLRPASVSRVRWSNAEMMNISRAFTRAESFHSSSVS